MSNESIVKNNSTPTSHAFGLCGEGKKTIYYANPW